MTDAVAPIVFDAARLFSDDIAGLADAEFRLYIMALAKSSVDRDRGVTHMGKPAIVQRWASLEGGKEACEMARDILRDKDMLTPAGHGAFILRDATAASTALLIRLNEDGVAEGYHPPAPKEADEGGLPTEGIMIDSIKKFLADTLPGVRDPREAYRRVFAPEDGEIAKTLAMLTEADEDGYALISDFTKPTKKGSDVMETAKEAEARLRGNMEFAAVQYAISSIFETFPRESWGRIRRSISGMGGTRWAAMWMIVAALDCAGADITGDPAAYLIRTATNKQRESAQSRANNGPRPAPRPALTAGQ